MRPRLAPVSASVVLREVHCCIWSRMTPAKFSFPSRVEFGGYFTQLQVPAVGGQHCRIPNFSVQGSPSIILSGLPTSAGALLGPAREQSPSLEGLCWAIIVKPDMEREGLRGQGRQWCWVQQAGRRGSGGQGKDGEARRLERRGGEDQAKELGEVRGRRSQGKGARGGYHCSELGMEFGGRLRTGLSLELHTRKVRNHTRWAKVSPG